MEAYCRTSSKKCRISFAHQCGYCSTVRSNVAKAEGLTEEMIDDLLSSYQTSEYLTAREKAALHYAERRDGGSSLSLIGYRLKCFPPPLGNDVQFRVRKPFDVVRAGQIRNFGTRAGSQRINNSSVLASSGQFFQ
jgi:hypothetical protein